MTTMQVNFRASKPTRRKLAALALHHGSKTQALTLAIDALYREEAEQMETRWLTQAEREAFPGDSSVDCAIRRGKVWYYADSGPEEDDPSGLTYAMFISDESGDHIEIRLDRQEGR